MLTQERMREIQEALGEDAKKNKRIPKFSTFEDRVRMAGYIGIDPQEFEEWFRQRSAEGAKEFFKS